MTDGSDAFDWDAHAPHVQREPLAAYDEVRARCPVARDPRLGWTVHRHADVVRVLDDPETFSNAVSRHLSVPNGMDPPEHGPYRAIVDRYFTPERMAAFAPTCRRIAEDLVAALPRDRDVEVMDALGEPFAVRMQCAFMGWPDELHGPLRQWMARNLEATRSGHRADTARVAFEFDATIREQLDLRREQGAAAQGDVTTELLRERVDGRPLRDEELVSLIRNWTVGELGTIAASVGILLAYLAHHPEIEADLRDDPGRRSAGIDEVLRLHGPLPANRRVTTCPVTLGGRRIEAGERVTVMWPSANRDEAAFDGADRYRPDAHAEANILYGSGIHACPGAPLARLELETLLDVLLSATSVVEPAREGAPEPAAFPAGGYARVPVRLRP